MASAAAATLEERILSLLNDSEIAAADICAGVGDRALVECRYPHVPAPAAGGSPLFLTASLTKPLIGMLIVQLAADGALGLNEPVRNFLPAFRRGPLRRINFRHLLTHTSGLPDMLPENEQLRAEHATVQQFAELTAAQNPAFLPGEECSYCSMGFAVLQLVIEQITGVALPQYLRDRVLTPLGMSETALGIPLDLEAWWARTVPCQLPPGQPADCDWNWNSRYWRALGAPWGGLTSTAGDLSRLLRCLLRNGRGADGNAIFAAEVVTAATSNQTQYFSALPEAHRKSRPWGLGWRLNWPDHAGCFSDFLPFGAWGHWGATGTQMWADSMTKRWCVILTQQPWEQSQWMIQRISNLLASSLAASGS